MGRLHVAGQAAGSSPRPPCASSAWGDKRPGRRPTMDAPWGVRASSANTGTGRHRWRARSSRLDDGRWPRFRRKCATLPTCSWPCRRRGSRRRSTPPRLRRPCAVQATIRRRSRGGHDEGCEVNEQQIREIAETAFKRPSDGVTHARHPRQPLHPRPALIPSSSLFCLFRLFRQSVDAAVFLRLHFQVAVCGSSRGPRCSGHRDAASCRGGRRSKGVA